MRVLILHNRYQQQGGEDSVVSAETALLRAHGVEVLQFESDNRVTAGNCLSSDLRLGVAAAWSKDSYDKIVAVCRKYRPDVAHVHNFWIRLSPSAHAACLASGAATVQTLHNFRLLCANALFLRDGKPCEDCLGKVPWRGVLRRCYRGSFAASAAVAGMIVSNRVRDTWKRDVHALIALSRYSCAKFLSGGLPADRLFIKPNFVDDPGEVSRSPSDSDTVLYLGRLSPEKGLSTVLSAWAQVQMGSRGRLFFVGDGPDREALMKQAAALGLPSSSVLFAGWRSSGEVRNLLEAARAVVLSSICYEVFPMSVAEALSYGRPVVVPGQGALGEIVQHGKEGLIFEAGDAAALGAALRTILRDDRLADQLGKNARASYLARYTPERNFEMLMRIYRFAVDRRGGRVPGSLRAFEPAEVAA